MPKSAQKRCSHCWQASTTEATRLAADTGAALPGLEAVLYSETLNTTVQRYDTYRRVTASDGSLDLKALPPGRYALCFPRLNEFLNPCHWSFSSSRIDTANLPKEVRLERGVLLAVRLDDPEGRAADLWNRASSLLKAVISSPRGSYLLRPQFQDDRFIEFSALTPPDTLFTLQVSSNTLSLADNAGKLLPAAAVFSVRSPKPRDPNAPTLPLPGMFRTRSLPKSLTLLQVQATR